MCSLTPTPHGLDLFQYSPKLHYRKEILHNNILSVLMIEPVPAYYFDNTIAYIMHTNLKIKNILIPLFFI